MAVKMVEMKITDEEFGLRTGKLLEHIKQSGYSGAILFERDYILYYTGFAFIPTERPMAFAMNREGEKALFLPRLEVEHAEANALIDRVGHYIEYPGTRHPMKDLVEMLEEMGISGAVGADHDGYPWIFGYRGPSLTESGDYAIQPIRGIIEDGMAIKSEPEIELLRESSKWANLAHMLLQRYTEVGATETEVSNRAGNEATAAMLDAIGPLYRAQSPFGSGASAGYRGQIGRGAAIPHALANNVVFRTGDVLVTGASAAVWGYGSELERTMIIGKPTADQRRFFDHMVALQDLVFESIKPGRKCSEVDAAANAYYEKHGLTSFWRHHSGHCIGLRYHEGPFLDIGDDTEIRQGMVFTVEPGLYVPELGGFRHSDTVAVTKDGIELLTYYPRDLESLILPG